MKLIVNGAVIDGAAPHMRELPMGLPGAFETVLVREREPVFWPEHWARFELGCRSDAIPPLVSAEDVQRGIQHLADANGVSTGVARWAAWHETTGEFEWTLEVTPPRPHMHKAEFELTWGPPLPDVGSDGERHYKHLRRAAWMVALRAARADGFDEVLFCDRQTRLVEAGGSNLFFVRAGKLMTPALPVGPLPGVMRQLVLEFAGKNGFKIREGVYTPRDLADASEVWLTNSLIGIRPVTRIGDRALPPDRPVLDELRRKWREEQGWDPVVVVGLGGPSNEQLVIGGL
jgi:4-amino-4-deoxychorismate lyase